MKKTLSHLFKYFLLFFFILLFITVFIFLSLSEYQWVTALYRANIVGVSLIFYLIFFSFILAVVTLSYLRSFEKKKLRKVEEGLRMMSQGHYSASIFLNMYSLDTPLQINEDIDRQFLKLHEKLMFMADEALKNAEESKTLDNETKNDILEGERKRIARELHDSVSQQLFAASMMLSAANQQAGDCPESLIKQLKMVEQTINASQTEMRALLLHLRPVQLDGKSLKEGVEQLLKELSSKIEVDIHYQIERIVMPTIMEDHFFRILQELLSNVLRHAKAEVLEVYLTQNSSGIQLRVNDDGVGFDVNNKKAGSYGLHNIKERIEGMGGSVKIVSLPNFGTRIEINVPLV
ncbi:two-component system, NarL family, sensor histidine kinase LiaS [Alkalibacterium putridalgicola]|uniref:Sensor histidine kinase n=2 Tax=Alkalibacterium putridalgicola TaxID=426703 RepID=A0A1H7Q950_9LACT|nr:sensor histidine kinase [Alkalibacterium putridalgicola]SEL44258.1 two-component system, NarL family, sensor histidine kinase LiaS [Alkalibacterium putridalgicola]